MNEDVVRSPTYVHARSDRLIASTIFLLQRVRAALCSVEGTGSTFPDIFCL